MYINSLEFNILDVESQSGQTLSSLFPLLLKKCTIYRIVVLIGIKMFNDII